MAQRNILQYTYEQGEAAGLDDRVVDVINNMIQEIDANRQRIKTLEQAVQSLRS